MSVSITIRDVPDETRDALAARAAAGGQSLQEYLRRELIDLAAKPDVDLLMQRAEARKRVSGSRLSADSILQHRDEDRP